ncbi:MAG: Asp-tRNA(Asn)/Glu-tRNA(Gln) amidotransferase subunit GatA [Candidatus Rokubacteria bacterium]|nr:Asp-tRNA(Asn)/Glu-tRNA(Gln) amidotransferase subunit GatA [Candidatus Rokubacteria bacterium]
MTEWTLFDLADAIRARRVSPVEATRAYLDRIDRLDGRLRAFITIDREGALQQAAVLEAEVMSGRLRGPLHGVPLGYKDLCFVRGLPTSCGTRTAEYFVDHDDATVVARLAAAGAITLGKLNMTELALGPFGENGHHGDVQNPWKAGHVSGGSSSGSGAAVGAGLVAAALGTDTGGSIRLPAACCGIVGLKPTYGRVSRAGVMPLSWSLDHVGPMTRTVRDAAMLLAAIAGHDPRDATTSRRAVPDYAAALARRLPPLTVGVPENFYFDRLDPEVASAVDAAIRVLETFVKVEPLRVPDPAVMVGISNVLARCESAAIHARLIRERPDELQPQVRERLEPGFHITAHDYLQAQRLRARLARAFVSEVFDAVDVLIAPVIPEPAPTLDEAKAGTAGERVARMGKFSRLTRPMNGLGVPALSVPCGFSADGRPIAFQLVGRPFAETTLFRVGHAYEQAAGWHPRRPEL